MHINDEQISMSQDEIVSCVTELLDGIDKNELSDLYEFKKYKYKHLVALFLSKNIISGGNELYRYVYRMVNDLACKTVNGKYKNNEKVKVCFLAISAAEWPAERLYKYLDNDERFEVKVIPVPLIGRDSEDRKRMYNQTYLFFQNEGYQVEKIYDTDTEEVRTWDDIDWKPDIVVHVSPWYLDIVKCYQITELPLSVINIYISYGLSVAGLNNNKYEIQCQCDKEFMNLMWRVYTETPKNYNNFVQFQTLNACNVRYSGYCKMDYFYEEHKCDENYIRNMWKVPVGRDEKDFKKVIIAPHFTVGNTSLLKLSTFADNMFFWRFIAKKYSDKVLFVFKPHPNLRNNLIINGYMESVDEYDRYLDDLRKLNNFSVMEEADYLTLFDTSDAMITDSASFIGEYIYTGKPLLHLTRPEQQYNALGLELQKAHYHVSGKDYIGIDEFLYDVVISGNDTMKEKRKQVYLEELDYVEKNGKKAAQYIYDDIIDNLFKNA